MIGRTTDVSTYDLMRWVRRVVRETGMAPRDAHVLKTLASYANREAKCWPSLKTLAEDCGYKPTRYASTDARGRTRVGWKCSSVSAALDRLQELQLIWSTQAGSGNSAVRELLYRPEADHSNGQDGTLHTASEEGDSPAFPPAGLDASSGLEQKSHNGKSQHYQQPTTEEPSVQSVDTDCTKSGTEEGKNNDEHLRVRAIALASLREAA